MPQVGMAIGAAAFASFPALGGAAIGALSPFASFLVRAALGLALNALAPKPGLTGGTIVTQRAAASHHQIIYGKARVGGSVIFDHTKGEDNKYLHRVIVFAGHEIESFEDIWFDDYKLTISGNTVTGATKVNGKTTDRFNGSRIYTRLGKSDQTAFSFLMDATKKWTSDHRARGRALLYIRLEYDEDGENYPTGLPNVSATIKGKKVYDPRSGLTEWSDNPALCWRDYLLSRYGLGENSTAVDDATVITAANACDTLINGLKRFTCNGSFYSNSPPGETLFALVGSMGGMFWYSQGKWRVRAPVWTAPTVSFNEDDLRSPISVSTRHSRRDNFNTVRGTFRGDETDWQATDFPPVTDAAFLSADNDEESTIDTQLVFTGTSVEARRIARLMLERNRQQITFTALFGLRAMRVQVGDFVNISNDRFGWTDKPFELVGWRLAFDEETGLSVEMTLQETAESVFDEVDDGIVYERDNTDLPDPFEVPDVGITLSSQLREFREKVNNELSVVVSCAKSYDLDSVEVQYKEAASTVWIGAGRGELGTFKIPDLEDGEYDVRARGINLLGVRGAWAEVSITLDALSQPPADVTNFLAEVNGAVINLSWTPVTDIDLSHYRVRYSPLLVNATWSNSITYSEKISRPASSVGVPARSGTFMIRAIDKSGIQSENYASVVVADADLEQFTTTLTQTEDPGFTGTKNGCEVVASELRIAAFDNFDSLTGNIDDQVGLWDDLGASYTGSSATYDFSTYIDAGSVKRCRVRVDAFTDRFDSTGGLFDDLSGNIDSLPGLWDNLTQNPEFDDTNVLAYVSTTDDDPTGSPTWSAYRLVRVADISARAFRFRIGLLSSYTGLTPSIGQLEAIVQHD